MERAILTKETDNNIFEYVRSAVQEYKRAIQINIQFIQRIAELARKRFEEANSLSSHPSTRLS